MHKTGHTEIDKRKNIQGNNMVDILDHMLRSNGRSYSLSFSNLYCRRTFVLQKHSWPYPQHITFIFYLAQLLFYTAISKLELATVATLGQTSTFFIVVLAIIIYNEHVGIWRWAAIFIGLFGAVLVIRPGSDIFTWNSLLPIGASFCYALSIVTLRSFTRDISNSILYLYSAAAAAFGAGIYASISITFTLVQSYFDMLLLLSMSFCGGFGVVCLMIAYRAADVSAIAPFNYFGILTSFILGWVIFGEFPVETLLPGVFFIVAAGLIIIWREKINKN
jgi:drug/metabolite transporter (DMT)-like permease